MIVGSGVGKGVGSIVGCEVGSGVGSCEGLGVGTSLHVRSKANVPSSPSVSPSTMT